MGGWGTSDYWNKKLKNMFGCNFLYNSADLQLLDFDSCISSPNQIEPCTQLKKVC